MSNTRSDERGIDLVSLGVADASKTPSVTNFPSKFSKNGFPFWHQIVVSPEFKSFCSLNTDLSERWLWAVNKYLRMCEQKMIFPFKISAEQSKTDIAIVMLTLGRRHLRSYFKSIDLFKKVKIFNATTRRYILKPTSFEIEITANLHPIRDPTFYDWLTSLPPGPMFRKTGKSRQLVKRLYNTADSRCFIHFDLSYMQHPKLTVNIEFGSPIVLPYHGKELSKAYIHRYIEENIWMPLVRTVKFEDAGWRLF